MIESPVVPVAVIGMACRLPGGVGSPAELWHALLRGEDFVTKVPLDRWDAEDYYDPEPGVPGRSVSKWGGFLDDPTGFDADFFGISEREATSIDPQHRLLLETSWEAVEHAGIDPANLDGSLTGVFLGLTHNDYQTVAAEADTLAGPYGFTGTNFSLASGRIAYALGARGPALTIDSACSSSLLAVHMASRSLRDGESNLALAGGACMMFDPQKMSAGSAQGMLSPTGRCHAFDVAADGFVSGEGVAMVLLKRLADAERDGDRVLAVIRGSAANQDGRTVNIATPSEAAQTAVYRAALTAAAVDPDTVGLVEAHGTGTPVGDPIEFTSLAAVYGKAGQCALGSVKTNIGHAQSASGVIGLIKTVLALQTGTVPPNLHFTALPEQLARVETGLAVPTETLPWPTSGAHPRRAAVSSYGLSGTNVHAVLEQAPSVASESFAPRGPWLFPVSSTSADELRRTAGRLANWVSPDASDTELTDLTYTLTRRRAHRPVRAAVAAADAEELIAGLREIAEGEAARESVVGAGDKGPVWLFSGQGSQWAGMGVELLAAEPAFAETIAELEPLIAAESGFSVTEAISARTLPQAIDRIQPTLFAMQVGMAAALRSRGVRPGAVIGHSMGEVAAAVVSGALSQDDGAKVICRRSRLMARISGSGAMAAVELPAQRVLSELSARGVNDVVMSVISSPQSTVVGGAAASVRALVAAWEEQGVLAREVAVDVASHSPQVDSILDELAEALEDLTPLDPTVPYYSATLYDPRDEPYMDADYWVDNLRHAVRFSAAVQAALEDGFRVFGELAPHPLLVHPTEHTARSLDIIVAALPAMRREQPMPHGLLDFVGDVHSAGAVLDLDALAPTGNLVDAPLPTWTHQSLLVAREGGDLPAAGGHLLSVHPLLGAHVLLAEDPERHVWQSDVGTDAQPWLADHQVHGVAALPGAAYCEMALSAARSVLGESCEIRDIDFEQLLLLDQQAPVSTVATASTPDQLDFRVESVGAGAPIRRAVAVLAEADPAEPAPSYDLAELVTLHQRRIDGDDLRKWFDQKGIHYGPAFAGLTAAHVAEGTVTSVLAEVALPGAIRSQQGAYGVHPALLDVCFQAVAGYAEGADPGGLLLPLGVQRLRAYAATRTAHYCYLRVTGSDATGVRADLDLLDETGAVSLRVEGLRLGTGMSEDAHRERVLSERLLTVQWQPSDAPETPAAGPGKWLLISPQAQDRLTAELATAIDLELGEVSTMVWPAHADHPANAAQLRGHFADENFSGVVVLLTDSWPGSEPDPSRGREYVQRLVHIARELAEITDEPPRFYVLTAGAQAVLPDDLVNVDQAGLRGLIRVLGTEQPQLRATGIDIDAGVDFHQVARQLLSDSAEDEAAWRAGQWYTARLSATPLTPDERRLRIADLAEDAVRLRIRTPGDISSMELAVAERKSPAAGQLEIRVRAANLDYDDVLQSFDTHRGQAAHPAALGTDFAGVVTAIGPGVTSHRVGDRVGGISLTGSWGTFVSCAAELAVRLPDALGTGHAAAVPTAYTTAWYALHDLARISKRDKVLIHADAGAAGLAAIAMARAAGAQVFATAASSQRRELLHSMGIDYVYDSRTTAFAEEIRRDTAGYGVDIVVNSLSGPAQRAGVELLAFGGRFIDIGNRDVNIAAGPGRNLSLHIVDMPALSVSRPDEVSRLLGTVFDRIATGQLPLPEIDSYRLDDCAAAIALMGDAEHTGTLVLDIPEDGGRLTAVVPPEHADSFRTDGAYLISGGLGGLGLFLAERMAQAGCGRLVLGARSQPSAAAEAVLDRIRGYGTEVAVVLGDIADIDTAQNMVAAATSTGLQVRGVLHAAAVVEDATLPNITDDLIARDWVPKVAGAWNLHRATRSAALDWFCSFSSAAALVGSPGQGAYAAANSWLDGFTSWRRSQGLPATTIAWGAWTQIGKGADFADASDLAITPDEGGYAFDTLLRYDRGYTGYAPIVGAPWLTEFAKRSPFAEAFRATADAESDGSGFLTELWATPREEWAARLRRLVSEQISLLLRRSIDPDRALAEYGIDSLGNLEVRTRIEAETGLRIGPADITTVRGLAEKLSEKLAAIADAELATST